MAYSGGSEVYIILYYIVLWAFISLVVYLMLKRTDE